MLSVTVLLLLDTKAAPYPALAVNVQLSIRLPSTDPTCRPLGLFCAKMQLINVTAAPEVSKPPAPVEELEIELDRKTQPCAVRELPPPA